MQFKCPPWMRKEAKHMFTEEATLMELYSSSRAEILHVVTKVETTGGSTASWDFTATQKQSWCWNLKYLKSGSNSIPPFPNPKCELKATNNLNTSIIYKCTYYFSLNCAGESGLTGNSTFSFSSPLSVSFKGDYCASDSVQPGALPTLKCKWIRCDGTRGTEGVRSEREKDVREGDRGKERWKMRAGDLNEHSSCFLTQCPSTLYSQLPLLRNPLHSDNDCLQN